MMRKAIFLTTVVAPATQDHHCQHPAIFLSLISCKTFLINFLNYFSNHQIIEEDFHSTNHKIL